jgi:sec-independent protein translocase protein TatB
VFEIGFWEIFLILVLALLVIGPERLPGAARSAGYWIGRARRYVEGVKSEIEQEFDVNEFKRQIRNQEVQINELRRKLSQDLDEDAPRTSAHEPLPQYDIIEDAATINADTGAAQSANPKSPQEPPV